MDGEPPPIGDIAGRGKGDAVPTAEEAAAAKKYKIDYLQLKAAVAKRGGWWMFDTNADVYEPRFAREAIDVINFKLDIDSPARLTYDDIGSEKDYPTEQEFLQKIDEMLIRDPSVIYQASAFLRYLFSPDEIKQRLATAGNGRIDYRFLTHFSDYKGVFFPEERSELLTQLVAQPGEETASGTLIALKDEDARAHFPPDKVHDLLVQAAQQSDFSMRHLMDSEGGNLLSHIRDQRITTENLYDIIVGRAEGLKDISYVTKLLGYYPPGSETEVRERIKSAVLTSYPERAKIKDLYNLVGIQDWFTPDEVDATVRSVVLRDRFLSEDKFISVEDKLKLCARLISHDSFQQLLREVVFDPDLVFDSSIVKSFLTGRLSEEDRERYIDHLVAMGRAGDLVVSLDVVQEVVTDESKQGIILRKMYEGRSMIGKIFDLFKLPRDIQQEELANASGEDVETAIQWLTGKPEQLASQDLIFQFFEKHADTHADVLLSRFTNISVFIPVDIQQSFVRRIIHANPVAALLHLHTRQLPAGVSMTPAEIIQNSKNDPSGYLSFAPRTIANFYNRYSFDKSDSEQKTLVKEANDLVMTLRKLRSEGMDQAFKRIQDSEVMTIEREQELLDIFRCLVLLKRVDPRHVSDFTQDITTFDQARRVLLVKMGEFFGREQQLTDQEVVNFFTTMKTPAPFLEYRLKFSDKYSYGENTRGARHRERLKEIFEAIIAGKFKEWKYGDGSAEVLERFKNAGILPRHLTQKQYEQWSIDEETTSVESLMVSPQEVTIKIKEDLSRNKHLLENDQLDFEDESALGKIRQSLSAVGRELATVNSRLAELRKGATEREAIASLEQQQSGLQQRRAKLLRDRRIVRLAHVTAEDLAAGYFFEQEEGKLKQRGENISRVLDELKASSLDENGFVYDEIAEIVSSLHDEELGNQVPTCIDSSDPKVWIEVGEKPVASCQSYRNGSYNEALLGYTEPGTKILFVINQRGKVIGRSVFRLLATEDGNPVLHAENIYSSSASNAINRIVISRAYKKAQDMGVPLFVSPYSQNEVGATVPFKIPEGYTTKQVDDILYVNGLRAPSAYVDSIGDMVEKRFSLSRLLQLEKTEVTSQV